MRSALLAAMLLSTLLPSASRANIIYSNVDINNSGGTLLGTIDIYPVTSPVYSNVAAFR
jgi:hypothetical protein